MRSKRKPSAPKPHKKKRKTYGDQPLCLRFRQGVKEQIEQKAHAVGLSSSEWIRRLAHARARRAADLAPPLVYEGPGARTTNEQVCVRFTAIEYKRIVEVAKTDGVLPSPWLRAVVSEHL